MADPMDQFKDVLNSIQLKNQSDIFLFAGTINDSTVDQFIMALKSTKNKANDTMSLVLTTFGGDPDAGFRMARAIKRYYSKFVLYVFGSCKSTGTLIALAADEIVMSDFGEFGPLDVQLTKEDELYNTSGLSYLQSLNFLTDRIFVSFENNFLKLKQRSGNSITTRTAAEVASKLSVGLIGPISGQLDPVKLGEVHRAINIAYSYGKRLCNSNERIRRLASDYPSHGFVIDFEEAQEIFENVRFVEGLELDLVAFLQSNVRYEPADNKPLITNLLVELDVNTNEDESKPNTQSSNEELKQNGSVGQTPNSTKIKKQPTN